MNFRRALLGLLGLTPLAAAVPAIDVKGNYFVNNVTGDRYQIVGVAYQPGGSAGYSLQADPLSNKDTCLRDAALLQILGVNAIRVYNVNPDLNHDECASIFNAAGMYMFIDVNSPLPGESISSNAPAANYGAQYLNRTFAVVEAFKSYPNTAAFFSGNEVIAQVSDGADVPPYIRAVTRDLKTYISKHADRQIPVGYSAADIRSILVDSLQYLQCNDANDGTSNDMSRVDLFALNSYSWCGNSSFTESGYDQLVSDFNQSSVPIFFSEYGCNQVYPRIFTEVPELYSDQMNGIFSGGIIYEYTEGVNNYGLVNVSSDGSVQLLEDFYTLKDRYATLNFTAIQGIRPPSESPSTPACSSSLIDASTGFTTNFEIPGVPAGVQSIIDNGVSPSPTGKIVTIDNYSVNFTVKEIDGNVLSNLKVIPLSEDQIDQPGANTQVPTVTTTATAVATATTTNYGSPSSTGGSTTSSPGSTPSKGSATAMRNAQSASMPWMMVITIITSLVVGFQA